MDTSNHTPLSWEEITNNLDGVKKQGIRQFIYQYKKHKDRRNDPLYWGDEVNTCKYQAFEHMQGCVQYRRYVVLRRFLPSCYLYLCGSYRLATRSIGKNLRSTTLPLRY